MFKRICVHAWIAMLIIGCSQSKPTASSPPTQSPPAVTHSPQAVSEVPTRVAENKPEASKTDESPKANETPVADAPQPPATVPDLLAKAHTAANAQNFVQGIQALEQALALEPENRSVLSGLMQFTQFHAMRLSQDADVAQSYPLFVKSADYLRKLSQIEGGLNEQEQVLSNHVWYNEACALAIQKQSAKALGALRAAIESGFDQLSHMDQDSDLDSLRDLAEYKELREKAPEILLAAAKEQAKKLIAAHQPFDFNFELPDLEGKTVSLADFKGKVLIVDVWGTWCPPCRMEVPHFVELHKKYRDAGLEIVGINYEHVAKEQVTETIKKFVEQNGVSYSCVIGDDTTQKMIPEFGAFPTTLFIDRTGKVRLKEVGYRALPKLEAIVTTLIAEGSSAPVAN